MSRAAVWRPIAPSDLDAVADLQVTVAAADRWDETPTTERVRWEYEHDLADPATDSLLCSDGAVLAAGWISANRGGARKHRAILSPAVHPAHRETIGVQWLARIEPRCREILLAHDDDLPRLIRSWGYEDTPDVGAMHTAAGYRAARWFSTMRRDLGVAVPHLALEVDVVPFTPAMSEAARDTHNASFADHWGSEPQPRHLWDEGFMGDPGFRADLSFVAVDGGEMVGYALNMAFPDDFDRLGFSEAWVAALGVRPERRGRGVGRALLARSLAAFRDAGFDRAALDVDTANPTGALGLYEGLGFVTERRSITWVKDVGPG